jgi:hypothetical protein
MITSASPQHQENPTPEKHEGGQPENRDEPVRRLAPAKQTDTLE